MPARGSSVVAYFVTPHGYGHAARAAAVIAALRAVEPAIEPHLFTTVPVWFFADSLGGGFTLHRLESDVGVVQRGPLAEDLPATVARLRAFFPPDPLLVRRLARKLRRLGCGGVVCDIAPLGIAIAREAGLPAVLVENFTWDWIYRGYARREPGFRPFVSHLAGLCAGADLRVQTEPACAPAPGAVGVSPVSRRPRAGRRAVREALGIGPRRKVVLVTMGGVRHAGFPVDPLRGVKGVDFVLAGGGPRRLRRGNVVVLPHRSGFFHPDLVGAADAVVGKIGYSTLAEACRAGVPFGHVPRRGFRESAVLRDWLTARGGGVTIGPREFADGAWIRRLPEVLAIPRPWGTFGDGAREAADVILGRIAPAAQPVRSGGLRSGTRRRGTLPSFHARDT